MKETSIGDPRSRIPAIHQITPMLAELFGQLQPPQSLLTRLARRVADLLRADERMTLDRALLAQVAEPLLEPGPRPVINATGILLHTNLGRAPLARHAIEAALTAVEGYTDLEIDPASGKRGHRDRHFAELARLVWQVEDATVVNNAAGALTLALAALGGGGETLVSRGEMIEIGGSFRLPEIMAIAGSTLVEVGTTNKTRLADYRSALGPASACLLKTHTSNYRIEGFTASVDLTELVELGRAQQVPVVMDLGSGLSQQLKFPPVDEPFIEDYLKADPDLLIFSGDKLFGSIQAGLVLGKSAAIARLRQHPMMRMLRLDKFGLSILCHQLRDLALGQGHPFSQLANTDLTRLKARAHALCAMLGPDWQVVEEHAYMGGGSLPQERRPGIALRYAGPGSAALADGLRQWRPMVIGYLRDQCFWLNLASVFPPQDLLLLEGLRALRAASF